MPVSTKEGEAGRALLAPEGGRAVLEEEPLPVVENGRLELMLIAETETGTRSIR
jgi:hypothetical protein